MVGDLSRSRAILISNAVFSDAGIEDLPAAGGCAAAMKSLLTGELCGWPAGRVEVLEDVAAWPEMATRLVELTEGVQDVLLIYYVGHGLRVPNGQLALALRDTSSNRALLRHTAMAYKDVAEILRDCPAATKLVILDCCHAELGNRATYQFQSADIDAEPVDGLYCIWASKEWEKAKSPLSGGLTYFTDAFIGVVQAGIPGKPPQLTIDQIFAELRARLQRANLPEPAQSGIRDAHHWPFAANAAQPETHRHPDQEIAVLLEWKAAAEAREIALQAQVADHARELERLRALASTAGQMTTQERDGLQSAISATERLLDDSVAAKAARPRTTAAIAQQQEFVSSIAPGAMAAQRRYGVPASVIIAQAIEESGWGDSELAAKHHNLFGIKGTGPAGSVTLPTPEYLNGQWVMVKAEFRAYRSDAESIRDHAELLATSRYYARAMADRAVPDAFANDLTGVYATDPGYGANLIALMKLYDLYRFDGASAPTASPAAVSPAAVSPSAGTGQAARSTGSGRAGVAGATRTEIPGVATPRPASPAAGAPSGAGDAGATLAEIPGVATPRPASPAGGAPSGAAATAARAKARIPGLVYSAPEGPDTSKTPWTPAVRPTGARSARVPAAGAFLYQARVPAAGASLYQAQLPMAVLTAFLSRAKGPLARGEHLYRDVAASTGIGWELLAAVDWMQCKADPRCSPVHGEKLGSANADGTSFRTKSAALTYCAAELRDLAAAVYGIDLTGRRLSIRDLAAAFAAFRWGAALATHGVSAMEFPYSVAGLTPDHQRMYWPRIDARDVPDRPGARYREPFGAVPVLISLGYHATV